MSVQEEVTAGRPELRAQHDQTANAQPSPAQARKPSRRLPKRATDALAHIAAHRVLTTHQVALLLGYTDRDNSYVRRLLRRLRRDGLIKSDAQDELQNLPYLHWATPSGIIAARGNDALDGVRLVHIPDASVFGNTHEHTKAVNDTGIIFTQTARDRGEKLTYANEVGHQTRDDIGRGQWANADLVITWDVLDPDRHVTIRIICEVDRDTKGDDRIHRQQWAYLRYRDYTYAGKSGQLVQHWHSQYPPIKGAPLNGFPLIVWVIDCKDADSRLTEIAMLITDPSRSATLAEEITANRLAVMMTTLDRLRTHGPLGPTFQVPAWVRYEQTTGHTGQPRYYDIRGNERT